MLTNAVRHVTGKFKTQREGKIEEKPTPSPRTDKSSAIATKKGLQSAFLQAKMRFATFCSVQITVTRSTFPPSVAAWMKTTPGAYLIFGQFLAYFWWRILDFWPSVGLLVVGKMRENDGKSVQKSGPKMGKMWVKTSNLAIKCVK